MAVIAEGPRAVVLRRMTRWPLRRGRFRAGSCSKRADARSRFASRSGWATRSRSPTSQPGEPVRKYGQIIGFASKAIPAGSLVHVHNLKADLFERDYAFATERPEPPRPDRPTNLSRLSAAGRPGRDAELHRRDQHRQLLGEHVALRRRPVPRRRLAARISPTSTASSPSRTKGAAGCRSKGPTIRSSSGCSPGFAHHPNVAAYVIVGLGCEVSFASAPGRDAASRHAGRGQRQRSRSSRPIGRGCSISRKKGGSRGRSRRPCGPSTSCMPEANSWMRTEQPASKICLAMECGGSDGNSGVTANPALGVAADLLVAQGGTAVLGETTEIYGAEHLLTRRAVSREVGRETGRPDQVVGVVHRRLRRQDRQQPVAGQQGRRPDDDLREVAGGTGQGRLDRPGRRRPVCRAGRQARAGLHGHARLRPALHHRPDRRRGQRAGLHHRARQRAGAQADPVHQGGDQHADVRADDRRHGPRRRHRSWKASRSRAWAAGSST